MCVREGRERACALQRRNRWLYILFIYLFIYLDPIPNKLTDFCVPFGLRP